MGFLKDKDSKVTAMTLDEAFEDRKTLRGRLVRRLRRLSYIVFHEWPWAIRHRLPPHRYHILKMGLKPGWYDRDFLLEHALLTIFRDFIEKEDPFEHFDTEDSSHKESWDEIKELYEIVTSPYFEGLDYEDITEVLVRIIKVRQHFWT